MKQPGAIVGRFEILRFLGEGGLARVYLARHRQLGTHHAIKFLNAANAKMTERLLREGRIQARLQHPNVVAVSDVVEVEGEVGLVMEYVEGFSIEDCVKDGGGMELSEALVLFSQVLSAVGTAHAAGILHRDIKPANVLLTSKGDAVIAKVADFGIAKFAKRGSGTLGGTTMGTPGYMAPEQVRDAATVTRRADIFALGALLYEMLSGKPAFPGTDLRGILNATAAGAFTPLSVHAPATPRRIIEATERALDPDPEHRFQDAEGFAQALGIPTNIIPPPQGLELAPVGEIPPVHTTNMTIVPEVEMAPDEEETGGRPAPSLRPPEPPAAATQSDKSLPSPAPAPRVPFVRRDSFEDVRDSMSIEERFGLDDPRVTLDRPHRPLPRSLLPQQPEQQDTDAAPEREAQEVADEVVNDVVWPILQSLANTARYLAVPVLLMVAMGYLGGLKGQGEVQSASRSYESAETQLKQVITTQSTLASELTALAGKDRRINALVEDTQQANTPELKRAASRKLSDAMMDELRMLPPPQDPAAELRRRELELQVQNLSTAHTQREQALSDWVKASGGVAGGLAVSLGMAPAPPR